MTPPAAPRSGCTRDRDDWTVLFDSSLIFHVNLIVCMLLVYVWRGRASALQVLHGTSFLDFAHRQIWPKTVPARIVRESVCDERNRRTLVRGWVFRVRVRACGGAVRRRGAGAVSEISMAFYETRPKGTSTDRFLWVRAEYQGPRNSDRRARSADRSPAHPGTPI